MTKADFKKHYSKYRAIAYWADQSARGKPCGTDDAILEAGARKQQEFCDRFPVIGQVWENSLDSDPLETTIQWRYYRRI